MPLTPRQEGASNFSSLYGGFDDGPPLTRLKAGQVLNDLRQDYELFNYTPLCLYGGLTFNPVQEWINEHNHKQVVFILSLDKPIFDMKGPPKLDHTLWAVEKPHWFSLNIHIGSLALIDRKKKALVRVLCQEIPIIDINQKMIIPGEPSSVTITTFSVDSNKECIAFSPFTTVQPRASLIRYSPREETIKLANALFAEKSNPYHGIQPYPWENIDENKITPAASVRS